MQSPLTNCPRCEALSPFRTQYRPKEDNIIEAFIRCAVCNWEMVIHDTTMEIERLRRVKLRWEAYNRAAYVKYGVPSSLAQAQVRKLSLRLQELEDEITD